MIHPNGIALSPKRLTVSTVGCHAKARGVCPVRAGGGAGRFASCGGRGDTEPDRSGEPEVGDGGSAPGLPGAFGQERAADYF